MSFRKCDGRRWHITQVYYFRYIIGWTHDMMVSVRLLLFRMYIFISNSYNIDMSEYVIARHREHWMVMMFDRCPENRSLDKWFALTNTSRNNGKKIGKWKMTNNYCIQFRLRKKKLVSDYTAIKTIIIIMIIHREKWHIYIDPSAFRWRNVCSVLLIFSCTQV